MLIGTIYLLEQIYRFEQWVSIHIPKMPSLSGFPDPSPSKVIGKQTKREKKGKRKERKEGKEKTAEPRVSKENVILEDFLVSVTGLKEGKGTNNLDRNGLR
jgi:hypothetical protein